MTHRFSKPLRVGLLITLAAAVLILILGSLSALSLRSHFLSGRSAMNRGRAQLLTGDAASAAATFAEAHNDFAQAASGARTPWLRVIGWIPIVGRTPHAVSAIAAAGVQISQAGRDLATALNGLPGGISALAPTRQGVPIRRLRPLTEAFHRADTLTREALATLLHAPGSLLLGPVGRALRQAEQQVRSIHDLLHTGSLLLDGLPDFLGQNDARRYFFGAENPAELRGTGGLIGAYSILTIQQGRLHFTRFRPIQSLPLLRTDQVAPPNPDYARNYDQFRGGKRFWTAINVTPDFPSAAAAIENAYEKATGTRLDGVITADPFALSALLRVTGPTVVPGLKVHVDAANVVAFTTNRAYALFRDAPTRKRVLGSVAKGVFERFLRKRRIGLGRLKILANAASEGHVLIYSNDASMEAGLARTGLGGTLGAAPGDFFSVVVNSSAGDKVDYFQERNLTYSVDLGSGGSAVASADVQLTNHAPTSGQPRYVIGPILSNLQAGDSVPLVHMYCGTDCQLIRAMRNGAPVDLTSGTDLGHHFYQDYFKIPSGQMGDLRITLGLPHVWEGNNSGGTYRLTFLNQTTINPTRLRVEVRVPSGMHIAGTSDSMQVRGDTAVWEGAPSRRLELEVSFQPSLPIRIWRDVLRLLSKPVIHL